MAAFFVFLVGTAGALCVQMKKTPYLEQPYEPSFLSFLQAFNKIINLIALGDYCLEQKSTGLNYLPKFGKAAEFFYLQKIKQSSLYWP